MSESQEHGDDTPAAVDQAAREPMNTIEEANFIKLEGRVYSITPIANQEMNLEAELKGYYNEKYQRHIDIFNGGIVAGMTEDWVGQLQKLQEVNQRHSVTIPPERFKKFLICADGQEIEECRAIIYSPDVFKMTRSDIADALNISHDGASNRYTTGKDIKVGSTTYDLNNWSGDQVILVKVKKRIFFPAIYSFNSRANRMHCYNVNTFHNQSDSICTGRVHASTFWNSENFEELMNQVNCFSLGSRHVHLKESNARHFGINDFVKRSYITQIQLESEGTWRT